MKNLKNVIEQVFFGLLVLLPIYASLLVAIYFIIFHRDLGIDSLYEAALASIKVFWLAGILFVLANFVSFFVYGSPKQTDEENLKRFKLQGWDHGKKLVVTYVSKGDNHLALSRAVNASHRLLTEMDVNFDIEVVTDIPVVKLRKAHVFYHVVPENYQTLNGAKYKARALHYLTEVSQVRSCRYGDCWIMHMDEESVLTPEVIAGIHKFVTDPDNPHMIGQGEIKYNSYGYARNMLITAIDSIRTGDDLGRFRFQFKMLHRPLFGMHGSFILVRNRVEKQVGFDLGGRGSITEDAYFALKVYERGYTFGWVDGYIREQSPYTIGAILKQRRRWFNGLTIVASDPKLKLSTRIPLLISVLLWSISWVSPVATIATFLAHGYFPEGLLGVCAFVGGGFTSIYLIGVYRNLQDMNYGFWKNLYIFTATLVLIPVASIVEAMAIVYGIFKPVKTFDIVNKN